MSQSKLAASIITTITIILMAIYIGWTWKILVVVPLVFFVFFMNDIRDKGLRRQRGLTADIDNT